MSGFACFDPQYFGASRFAKAGTPRVKDVPPNAHRMQGLQDFKVDECLLRREPGREWLWPTANRPSSLLQHRPPPSAATASWMWPSFTAPSAEEWLTVNFKLNVLIYKYKLERPVD